MMNLTPRQVTLLSRAISNETRRLSEVIAVETAVEIKEMLEEDIESLLKIIEML